MIDLSGMNEAQRLAVTHGEGPLLLLAGPGSGKTYTITQRILYLLESGTPPQRILVITFTKDAAVSMQQRFRKLSPVCLPVNFGTFHSVFYHMLKESGCIGTEHPLNQSRKKKILLPVLKDLSEEAFKELLQEDTTALLAAMSYYKNTLSLERAAVQHKPRLFHPQKDILRHCELWNEHKVLVDHTNSLGDGHTGTVHPDLFSPN